MIESKGVTIETVSVTIKALKVNNRQMTQAVFNQLPKLDVLTPGGALVGNIWGWVNYRPKGENEDECQFVFEANGRLYRGASEINPIRLEAQYTHDATTTKLLRDFSYHLGMTALAIVADAAKKKTDKNPCGKEGMSLGEFKPFRNIEARWAREQGFDVVTIRMYSGSSAVLHREVHADHAEALKWGGSYDGSDPWYKYSDKFIQAMESIIEQDQRAAAHQTLLWMIAHIEAANRSRDVLRKADQLFIAV